ncbi:tRNA(His) guanylyltransferase 1-like isoform X1 [Ipomoea triloba]|uniref:tRNA(His) guanylyltransferase 1-like isoform X1 n=1 Tax=Ipomoea triloba TaxID=35885 RepID=UPI00125DA7F7|nr:tRNA(His) guanylyltransferase 1-like isoform X1 [Ipomoea triloba]XP_031124628.1 tRNA(His) guanylyltransferase 1-like isoform X1 [Ipomoea triloba]
MANSKYEYVKSFEVEDEVMVPNIIVVRVDGRDFGRFSEAHEFDKPYDAKALHLMNACSTTILEEFPDIAFAYGFSDEFSFVFKKETKFYQRRASKIYSLIVSFFTSVFVTKWKDFFPQLELRIPPSFKSCVIRCASMEVLQAYLTWRQNECHIKNLYATCFWELVKCGKPEIEAKLILKGTQKQEKNELLFQQFGINYKKDVQEIFRQGSCALRKEIEDIVKYQEDGTPVRRRRKKVIIVHSENITARSFWNDQQSLSKDVGSFGECIENIKPEYIKSFQFESRLMPSTWIVIRIDGCHFHRFCDAHGFDKPNDVQALNLMNSCAVSVVEEFKDIVFAYGVSDEYSFVLKKDSLLYERHASEIVSAIVSLFSCIYMMKWKEFFPQKDLKYPPYFDGRSVCYPSSKILRDYLTWRQVDCHINNQYNTCFWMLVKSGKSKTESQNCLKGTQTREKNEMLSQFGIDYHNLPAIFRQGSSVFWDKEETKSDYSTEGAIEKCRKKVVVEHCNIIDTSFWKAHPTILEEDTHCVQALRTSTCS